MQDLNSITKNMPRALVFTSPEQDCKDKCERINAEEGNKHKVDGYNCDICRNKGYVMIPALYNGFWEEQMKICACDKARRSIRELRRNGLDTVVNDFTLDKYMETEPWQRTVKETARRYIADEGTPWFFFGGESGCGKTHICTAVAIELLNKGQSLKYMVWRRDANYLKQSVTDGQAYRSKMDEIISADILYIDDLFKTGKSVGQDRQIPSQGDINLAFEILNQRYLSKKRTIISSESTLSDLLAIDVAVAGRIKQMSEKYIIQTMGAGKNYRLKN